jgi:hypothetical protein
MMRDPLFTEQLQKDVQALSLPFCYECSASEEGILTPAVSLFRL